MTTYHPIINEASTAHVRNWEEKRAEEESFIVWKCLGSLVSDRAYNFIHYYL